MKCGYFSASWETVSFSTSTLLRGVIWMEVLDISPFSNKEFCQGTAEREAENKWIELYLLTNPLRDEIKKKLFPHNNLSKSLFS
jgi:hypothetical protein